MPWFRLDDSFHSHPKVIAAGNEAIGLYVRCGTWLAAHQAGEFIPRDIAAQHGSSTAADQLVRAGLWQRARRGYRMPSYVSSVPGSPPRPLWSVERDDYRRKIPPHVKGAVFERDNYQCTACGATEDLTLDHIHPWSLGGPDTEDNLRVLCRSCNASKGARV